jgi:hypothetical protein
MKAKRSSSVQDQATGSRRSVEASDTLNIPVNSFSLADRIPRSSVRTETEHDYNPKTGSFTETKRKASVLAAAQNSQMQLGHRAVTSVRNDCQEGYRTADMYNPASSHSYGPGRRRNRVSDED